MGTSRFTAVVVNNKNFMSIENPDQQENYSEEEISQWENGARNFASFWGDIGAQEDEYDQKIIGPLQAMFLGEKPAMFHSFPVGEHGNKLEHFGLKSTGNYIYDPKQVAKIIGLYSDVFRRHNLNTPEEVMGFLDKAKPEEHSVIRGLVLGFPYEAIRRYSNVDAMRINQVAVILFGLLEVSPEEQVYLEENYFTEKRAGNSGLIPFFKEKLEKYKSQLGISDNEIRQLIVELHTQIETKRFGAHGVFWIDSDISEESASKEKRIKDAFEKSGIRNADK